MNNFGDHLEVHQGEELTPGRVLNLVTFNTLNLVTEPKKWKFVETRQPKAGEYVISFNPFYSPEFNEVEAGIMSLNCAVFQLDEGAKAGPDDLYHIVEPVED